MKIKTTNITNFSSACRQTGSLASPIILSRLINVINTFIGMLFIAKLGHVYLAAGALVTPISTMLLVTVWSLLFSVGVVCGHAFGAGKKAELGDIVRASLILGTIAGLPIIFIMLNIAPILRFFHQQENIITLVQQYFYGLSWSVLPGIWYLCFSQFIIAINKPKIVLFWTWISIPCTLIPGYGLLFGKFGLPAIGISGIAYANSFASFFILLLTILYLLRKEFKIYRLFSWRTKINTKLISKLFSLGYPISIQFGAELAAFSISAIFFGWLSEDALAAFQTGIQINMIIIMIPYGLAQASAILIGQALGRNEKSATKLLGNAALAIGIGFMLLVAAAYLLIPKILMSMYLDIHNPANFNTVHIAVILFAICAFSQFFDGIRNIVTGSLRGFHDTKSPMLVGILASCIIGIPVNYFLGFALHLGPAGLALGFTLGVTLGAFILLHRFYKKASIQPDFGQPKGCPYNLTN